MSQRTERVGDQIRGELGTLLLRDVRDPRVKLATVSRVQVSRDLGHARVLVSVLGSEEQRAAAIEALNGASGYLRRELASRLSLRTTPQLAFVLDRGAEHSLRIAEILDRERSDEPPSGS